MKYDREGWQCFVKFEGDKVVKKIKTKKEISKSVKRYLESKDSLDLLGERVEKIHSDIGNSLKIVEISNTPKSFLANAKIKENIIEQDKVISVGEKVNELIKGGNEKEAKKVIEDLIDFIIELWEYKIHENTYKFYSNYGVDKNGSIVLIDFLEITDDKEKVKKQIKNKKWEKPEKYLHKIDKKIADYFIEQANKKLTLNNLEKNWRVNVS